MRKTSNDNQEANRDPDEEVKLLRNKSGSGTGPSWVEHAHPHEVLEDPPSSFFLVSLVL